MLCPGGSALKFLFDIPCGQTLFTRLNSVINDKMLKDSIVTNNLLSCCDQRKGDSLS